MKKLKIFLIWTFIASLIEISSFALLNHQVAQVMAPPTTAAPKAAGLKTSLPDAETGNVQLSYSKDYLSYISQGTLKVFNLKANQVVFEKQPLANEGIINYQWLPDRDILLYFYGKVPSTQAQGSSYKPTSSTASDISSSVELHTVDFPASTDKTTPPDDRVNKTINHFPSGGQIPCIQFSTQTNLIFFTIAAQSGMNEIMEIDVNQNCKIEYKPGETIHNIAVSDRDGLLYTTVKSGALQKTFAMDGWESGWQRRMISTNREDTILGVKDGTVYIGQVQDGNLTAVLTTPDMNNSALNLNTLWTGSIPFDDSTHSLINNYGQLIIYNTTGVHILNGLAKDIPLRGNFTLSVDGSELVTFSSNGTSTIVELKALD